MENCQRMNKTAVGELHSRELLQSHQNRENAEIHQSIADNSKVQKQSQKNGFLFCHKYLTFSPKNVFKSSSDKLESCALKYA